MPLWLHLPETVVGLFLAAICIGWWHIAQERSRRKRAAHDARVTAADLEENRTRLDLALRAAGMGIWYWDIVENRRHFDPQVCELLGIDAEAFTGSAEEFFRVVHPDDREMLMSALARTVEDDVMCEPVYRVINRDERVVRHVAARGRLARDAAGRPMRVDGVLWDVTERKQMEETLRRREDDLRNVLDNMPAMIGYWDSNFRNRFGNKAYIEWFGIDPADMPGKHIRDVIGEERYVLNLPYMEAALRGELQVFERAIPTPDGSGVRHSQASYIPDVHDGTVRGFYVLVTDITKVKEAECAAEAANRAKSQFLANMSHEIRTPMNGIIGLTHLALQADPTPRLRDYLERIDLSARSLMGILNDILDISKIEAGMLTMERVPFELRESLRRVVGLMKVPAEGKNMTLSLTVAEEVPQVLVGDPLRLEQILLNLLGNAVKFTERGGVTVLVSLEEDDAKAREAVIRISVTDSGIGIEPDQLERIFDPFAQSDSSTTRKFGGTGLGLSICSSLVKVMGGELRVESRPGEGSTFAFTARFGVAEAAFSQERGSMASGAEKLRKLCGGRRVLLVEDNQINRQVAIGMLQAAGLVVDCAENGEQALQILSSPARRYDLVLMDIQMPVMDGYEATRRIRRQWSRDELPVVAMTAHAMRDDRQRCMDAGMNDYLSKPIEPATFYTVLGSLMNLANEEISPTPFETRQPVDLPDSFLGIDLAAVRERVGDNIPLMMELFLELDRSARQKRDAIAAAVENGDVASLRTCLHGLKGMAGNLGADAVYGTCGKIEGFLALEDLDRVRTQLAQLDEDLAAMYEAIVILPSLCADGAEAEKSEQDGIMKAPVAHDPQ